MTKEINCNNYYSVLINTINFIIALGFRDLVWLGRIIISLSFDKETDELIEKAEKIVKAEGKRFNLSKILRDIVKAHLIEYVKNHGDGNPITFIDDYMENDNFQATPMIFRKPDEIREFLRSIRNTSRWPELEKQLNVWVQIFNEIEKGGPAFL